MNNYPQKTTITANFSYCEDLEFSNAGVCYDCTRWGLAEGGGECALNRPEFSRKHCEQFEPLAF